MLRILPWTYVVVALAGLFCAGSSRAAKGTFVDEQGTFRNNGDSSYVEITINGSSQQFAFYVASDYGVQAAIFHPSQLQAFISNQAFSAIELFDNSFGSRFPVLAPGPYVVGIRNTGGADNRWKMELDEVAKYPPTENATLDTTVISDVRYVNPGGRVTMPFTVTNGKRLTVDGCNSGLKTYVIPADQVGAFSAGNKFNYFTAFPPNGESSPGYWDLNLPPGSYALAYWNDSKKAKAVVTSLLRWNATDDTLRLVGNARWRIENGTAKVDLDALENRSPHFQICRVNLLYYLPLDAVPYRDSVVAGSQVLGSSLSPGQRMGPIALSFPLKLPSLGKYRIGVSVEVWNGSRWVERDKILFDDLVSLGLDSNGKNPNAKKIISPKQPSSSSTPDPFTVSIRFNRNLGNPEVDNAFWLELINSEFLYNLFTPPMPPPAVTRTYTFMTLNWTNVTDAALTKQEFLDILREFCRLANADPTITYAGTFEIVGDTDGQPGATCPTTTPTLINLTASTNKNGYIQVTGQVGPEGPIAEQTWDIYRSTQPSFSSAKKILNTLNERQSSLGGTIQPDAWIIDFFALSEPRTRSGGTVLFVDKEVTPGTNYYYWVRVRAHDLKVRTPRSPLEMTPTGPGQVISPFYWKPCRYLNPSALSAPAVGVALPGTGASLSAEDSTLAPPVSSGFFNIGYTPPQAGSPSAAAAKGPAAAGSPAPVITNTLSWITVTPNTTNNTLNIQFTANPGNTPRTGSFLVDGHSVTVTQEGPFFPETTLRPGRQVLEAAAGSFVLDISSNTNWSITDLPGWITTETTSGEGNAKVALRFEANPFSARRSALIRVNDESLVISQKGGALIGTFVGMLQNSTGYISMSVVASGAVAATVMLEFDKVILRGQLQGLTATLTGRSAKGEILNLTVPMVNDFGHAFSSSGVEGTLTSVDRSESTTLYWSGAYSSKNPGSWKRSHAFTIDIPGWAHQGVANAVIDPSGNCKLSGKLPDGTPFAWAGKMAFENRIIFHKIVKRSYHPEGDLALAGDISFYESFAGWHGVISMKAKGRALEMADVVGEAFDPSMYDGHLIFPMHGWGPNTLVSFTPTSIDPKPVDRLIRIGNSGPIGFSPVGKADLFTFKVDRAAGTFTGSFSAKPPLSGGAGYFSGVFLQGSHRGVGFYVGPAGAGAVEVRPLTFGTGTVEGSNRLQAVSGQSFNHQVSVSFSVASYTLQGALPDGLGFNASTGTFSGTPTGTGTFYLIVTAHGSGGQQATRLLRLDLQPHLLAQSGTYLGLVGEVTPRQETSGKMQVTLSKTWSFSASMVINGTSHRFKGSVDPTLGTWSGSIPSTLGRRYNVTLTLVDHGASSQINGQVSEPTLSMQSDVLLDRQSFDKVYDRCLAQGYYTFSTSGVDGNTPVVLGYGTATIQPNGKANVVGTAGDGARWTLSTVIARRPEGLLMPIYVNPYPNRTGGAIYGDAKFLPDELHFASWQPDHAHHVHWWKSPNLNDKLYPAGFGGPINMSGSIYREPAVNSPLFTTTGPLVFNDGTGEYERTAFQLLGNRIVMQGSDRVSITVNLKTGVFSGTYQPVAGSPRKDRLTGVIDRESQYGFGHWLSPNGINEFLFVSQ